jgi:hypothetical protein
MASEAMLASSSLEIMSKSNIWAWFGYRSLILSRFMLFFQAHFALILTFQP